MTHPSAKAICHLFDYPWAKVIEELTVIKDAGFTHIQLSPPQLSRGPEWWARYQPLDFRVLESPLGNKSQLTELISEAHRLELKVIADVVVHHMANLGEDFDLCYPPADVAQAYGLSPLFTAENFKPFALIHNWYDPVQVRNGRLHGGFDSGLPTLDLIQDHVFQVVVDYLLSLKGLGFDGLRLDAVKHMEPEFFKRLYQHGVMDDFFVFGESIAFEERDFEPFLLSYLNETPMDLMDFPLFLQCYRCFQNGEDLSGLLNPSEPIIPRHRSVGFAINHDIPNNQIFRDLIMAPAHEKLSLIWLSSLKDMSLHFYSDLGKEDGLKEDRWYYAHRTPYWKSCLQFFHEVWNCDEKIEVMDSRILVNYRGHKGIAILNPKEKLWSGELPWPRNGVYHDLLSGRKIEVIKPNQHIDISGKNGQLWLAVSEGN